MDKLYQKAKKANKLLKFSDLKIGKPFDVYLKIDENPWKVTAKITSIEGEIAEGEYTDEDFKKHPEFYRKTSDGISFYNHDGLAHVGGGECLLVSDAKKLMKKIK